MTEKGSGKGSAAHFCNLNLTPFLCEDSFTPLSLELLRPILNTLIKKLREHLNHTLDLEEQKSLLIYMHS